MWRILRVFPAGMVVQSISWYLTVCYGMCIKQKKKMCLRGELGLMMRCFKCQLLHHKTQALQQGLSCAERTAIHLRSVEWSWMGRTCRSCEPLVSAVQRSLPKSGMPKEETGLDPGWHLNLSLFLSSDYSFKWTVVVSMPGKGALPPS